jgi:hypothetical protein
MEGRCEYIEYAVADSRQETRGSPQFWGLGEALKTPTVETRFVANQELLSRTLIDNLVRSKQRIRDMRFGKWNMDLQEVGGGVWTGSMWLSIRTAGGHL